VKADINFTPGLSIVKNKSLSKPTLIKGEKISLLSIDKSARTTKVQRLTKAIQPNDKPKVPNYTSPKASKDVQSRYMLLRPKKVEMPSPKYGVGNLRYKKFVSKDFLNLNVNVNVNMLTGSQTEAKLI